MVLMFKVLTFSRPVDAHASDHGFLFLLSYISFGFQFLSLFSVFNSVWLTELTISLVFSAKKTIYG